MSSSKSSIKEFLMTPSITTSKKRIGQGSYAAVFDSDSFVPNTVVKRHKPTTTSYKKYAKKGSFLDAWLLWALYCMGKKHRSFMPKVLAIHMDWNKGTYYAIMEKLVERKPGSHRPCMCDDLYSLVRRLDYLTGSLEGRGICVKSVLEVFTDLEEMLPEILYVDGHTENWMYRNGKTLVMTDPLHLGYSSKGDNTKMKRFNEAVYELACKAKNVVQKGKPDFDVWDEEQ